MEIKGLICDVCKKKFPFKKTTFPHHLHPELDIDGTPINFWSPICDFSDLEKKQSKVFLEYIPNYLNNLKFFGEGNTKLYKNEKLSEKYKCEVLIKDESSNPTGSFKDRGFPFLIADALQQGKKKIAIPSTGNAAISLCYYSRKNKLTPLIFIPETTSNNKKKIISQEAETIFDKDIIQSWNHFFSYCRENKNIYNGFTVTNIPYQQGLKSIMYEIFWQLGNKIPDWIVIPCGSGGNLVSQYQACMDLYSLNLIKKFPKFVSVQIEGGDPLTIGYNKKQYKKAVVIDNIKMSKAEGIVSDTCFNYLKIMNILKQSKGMAVSVSDEEIDLFDNKENKKFEYTSLSVLAALDKLKPFLRQEKKIVLILTAKRK